MQNMTQARTLAIDIGGSGIKAALLNNDGSMIGDRQRVPTPPKPVAPQALVRARRQAHSVTSNGCRSAFPAMCATGAC